VSRNDDSVFLEVSTGVSSDENEGTVNYVAEIFSDFLTYPG